MFKLLTMREALRHIPQQGIDHALSRLAAARALAFATLAGGGATFAFPNAAAADPTSCERGTVQYGAKTAKCWNPDGSVAFVLRAPSGQKVDCVVVSRKPGPCTVTGTAAVQEQPKTPDTNTQEPQNQPSAKITNAPTRGMDPTLAKYCAQFAAGGNVEGVQELVGAHIDGDLGPKTCNAIDDFDNKPGGYEELYKVAFAPRPKSASPVTAPKVNGEGNPVRELTDKAAAKLDECIKKADSPVTDAAECFAGKIALVPVQIVVNAAEALADKITERCEPGERVMVGKYCGEYGLKKTEKKVCSKGFGRLFNRQFGKDCHKIWVWE